MTQTIPARAINLKWHSISVMLLIVLLLPLTTVAPRLPLPARAQPVLLAMAAEQPGATVDVVVQKLAQGAGLEQLANRLGGRVTRDIPMINAFAVKISAQAAAQLAAAPGIRWVSLDAPMQSSSCTSCVDTSNLSNPYIQTIGADRLWNQAPYLQGQGVAVAEVDSGIVGTNDFKQRTDGGGDLRITAAISFDPSTNDPTDRYGHGTHVAGIIAGNGSRSNGTRIGVAPNANLVNLKVSDNEGNASMVDILAALQWIYDNHTAYNIRVVNLSLNSSVAESYLTNPLDAALEILWFNGVVVVASAGNNGANAQIYPPANDPFIITVGATDDRGTANPGDDAVASYSSYGTTSDGFAKPDLVAPGTNIISMLSNNSDVIATEHPDHFVTGFDGSGDYFRMTGTSMAAPVVSGAVTLLLQDEPGLTPDQVKYRLKATARPLSGPGTGAGYLNIYAAVHTATTQSANTGTQASQLLWSGTQPLTWTSANWNSANWNSANWNSANWNSANWNSANWNSANWNSDFWDK